MLNIGEKTKIYGDMCFILYLVSGKSLHNSYKLDELLHWNSEKNRIIIIIIPIIILLVVVAQSSSSSIL